MPDASGCPAIGDSTSGAAGPNPTHQVHVTFFWIWLWLIHIVQLKARQVELLMDCTDPGDQSPSTNDLLMKVIVV